MNLDETMKAQRELQIEFYSRFMRLPREERLRDNLKHIIHETIEVERETNFKHWKIPVKVNWYNVRTELVDVFIFFMNACNESGLSAKELLSLTAVKQEINRERQRTGY